MQWRIALLAGMLVLAGCPGAPSGDPEPTATVTPAPEPTPIGAIPSWLDAPAGTAGSPTINGSALADSHADATRRDSTRTVHLRIESETRLLLEYRADLTVAETGFSTDRRYRGPATARFVPGSTAARSSREQYYNGEAGTGRRQVVDGRVRTDDGAAYPQFEPALRIDPNGYIETLLDGVPIRNRTDGGRYVTSTQQATLPGATVPRYLSDPRNAEIRARIDESGRVERLVVTYEATDDGRPVRVEQTLLWGPAPVGDEPHRGSRALQRRRPRPKRTKATATFTCWRHRRLENSSLSGVSRTPIVVGPSPTTAARAIWTVLEGAIDYATECGTVTTTWSQGLYCTTQ